MRSACPESTRPTVVLPAVFFKSASPCPSNSKLICPLLRETALPMSWAPGSRKVAYVESSVKPAPERSAPAPIVREEALEALMLERLICAEASALTRTNAPLPPSVSECASLERLSVCSMSAPGARVRALFATKMMSFPFKGLPALSTVMFCVVTVTLVPSMSLLREPPINKLSAPMELSVLVERNSVPAAADVPRSPIRMSLGLLTSTWLPRPPSGAFERTEPARLIACVACRSNFPESLGKRTDALASKNVLAL